MKQLELGLRRWGGKRKGAGRKGSGITSVPHRARPEHKERYPVHVTWRVVRGLPSLRSFAVAREIGQTISRINEIHDGGAGAFRIVHFSIQPNHVHLIVEGTDKSSLMKGLKGLAIQVARRINRAAGTRGRVIAERYHARVLRHPRQVRNCISYVLHNHKHHQPSRALVDPLSSGRWFTGWAEAVRPPKTDPPIVAPHGWLARSSWRKYGLISVHERPADVRDEGDDEAAAGAY